VTSTLELVDGLKVLDLRRPIREDRHNCADGDHVTGWKSSETRASVKWIEVVDAIPDERGTVLHPRLGPCATEGKLEPILGRIRNS